MSTNENSKETTCAQIKLGEDSTKQLLKADYNSEDFYGDQSDNIAFDQEIANKQFDKYASKFYNEGFREALSFLEDEAGEDASNSKDDHILQTSFDQGYETVFVISKQLFIHNSVG